MSKQISNGEEFRLSVVIDATTKTAKDEIAKLQSTVTTFASEVKKTLDPATQALSGFSEKMGAGFVASIPILVKTAGALGLVGSALKGIYDVYDLVANNEVMKQVFAEMEAETLGFVQEMGSVQNVKLADILFVGVDLGPPQVKAALAEVKAEIYSLQEPLKAVESVADKVQEALEFDAGLAGLDAADLAKISQVATAELAHLEQGSTQLLVSLRESLGDVGDAASSEIQQVIDSLQIELVQGVAGADLSPKQKSSAYKAISEELIALKAESSKIASGLGDEFGAKLQAAFSNSKAKLVETLAMKGVAVPTLDGAFDKAQAQASNLIARVRQDVAALNQAFAAAFTAAVDRSRKALQEMFGTLSIDPAKLKMLSESLGKVFAQAAESGKKVAQMIAGNISDSGAWVKFTQNAESAIDAVRAELADRLEDIGLPKDAFSEAMEFAGAEFDDLAAKARELGSEIGDELNGIGKAAAGEFGKYLEAAESKLGGVAPKGDGAAGVKAQFASLKALAEKEFADIGEGMGLRLQSGLKAAQDKIGAIFKQGGQSSAPVDRQFSQIGAKAKVLLGGITQDLSAVNAAAGKALEGYIDTAKESFADFFKTRPAANSGSNDAAALEAQRALEGLKGAIGEAGASIDATLSNPKPWAKFAAHALSAGDGIFAFADSVTSKLGKIRDKTDMVAGGFAVVGGALSGLDEPMQLFNRSKQAIAGFAGGMGTLVQEIGFFGQGLDAIKSLATTGPFHLLIGQNVELRQQLLGTQASLVATNKVIRDGQVLNDPKRLAALAKVDPKAALEQQKEAIKSLSVPVETAIKSLRAKSLDLVGVTSKDLIPVFQIISRFSSQLGLSMEQVSELTASTAASMGTMGIPLHQAQQEVSSILSGNIDMNSVMAKNLGLTNEMVAKWKSQGRVFEELNQRLSAFRAGNALMAETIEGIGSNIQEIIDEVGRAAGEQLLEPVVKQLESVYKYLKDNMDGITAYGSEVIGIISEGVQAFVGSLGIVFNTTDDLLATIPKLLATTLRDFLLSISNIIKLMAPIVEPFIQIMTVMAQNAQAFVPIMGQLFIGGKAVQMVTKLMSDGFGTFAGTLPGVGELLFLLKLRNHELVKSFLGLAQGVGPGIGGMLSFATHLNKIPGGTAMAAKEIAKLHPMLGAFAPIIAEQLPAFGKFGTMLFGMSKQYAFMGQGLELLMKKLPGLSGQLGTQIDTFAPLIDKYIPGLSAQLKEAVVQMGAFSSAQDLQTFASQKVAAAMKAQAAATQLMIAKATFFIAIGALLVIAFKELILKNEKLMEILKGVGSGLKLLADMLMTLLGNPITLTLIALGSLIFALKTVGTTAAIEAAGGLWKFIAAQSMLSLGKAAPVLMAIAKGLGAIGLIAPAGATAVTTFNASVAAGTVTMGGFAAAVWAVAAPIAVLAAAIGAIAIIRMTKEIEGANEALEIYARNTARVSESAMQMEKAIRDNQKAQKSKVDNGIALSEEEYKRNKILREQTKLEVQGIDLAIRDLQAAEKDMQTDEQKRNAANQIAELQGRKDKLNELINTTKLAPQELPRVGQAYEQLSKQVGTALLALAKPSGEVDKYNEQAKKLLEGTQALLESGRITVADAVANYEKLANNEFVDKETQLNAQKAITAALKVEQERRLEDIKVVEAETQSLIEAGRLGEAKGAKLITEAKKTELDAQLQYLIEAKKKEDEIRKAAIEKESAELDKNLKTAQDNLATAEKGGKPEDIARAKKEVEDIETAKSTLQKQAQAQQSEANRKFKNEEKKIQGEQAAVAEKQLKQAFEAKQKFIQAGQEIEQASLDRGLTSQTASAKKRLELSQQSAASEIAEIQRQKKLLSKDDIDGLKALEAKESQARASQIKTQEEYQQKLLEIKTKAIEADQQIAEAALAKGDISDSDMAGELLELSKERLKVEEEATRKQLAMAGKNVEKRHELEGKLAGIQKAGITAEAEYQQKVVDLKLKGIEAELKVDEAKAAKGDISDSDLAAKAKASADARIEVEAANVQRQIALAGKNVDKRKQLEGTMADLEKSRIQALKDYYAKVIEIRSQVNEAENNILQLQIRKGGISESDAIAKVQAMTNSKLDIQQEGLERELAMAGKNVEKRRVIEGKLALIETERLAAAEKAADERMALMEREAQKATDVMKAAAANRDLYVQKFRLANPFKKEAADVLAAQSSLKTLQGEYDQTIAMRRRLESVSYSDPKREAERQAKIRELKIRGIEQTRQLLAQEAEVERAQVAQMQAAIKKASVAKVLEMQKEERATQTILSIHESIGQAMENQNRLLAARGDLENAISGYAEGQFSIASKLEKNEGKRQKIEEDAARARLIFLDRQQELERASLENELNKNKLMLDREKIQNRLEQISARIATEEKQAELAALQADPKASKADIARAKGQVEIAVSKEQLVKFKAVSLEEQGSLLDKEGEFKRLALKDRQGLAKDNARVDLAVLTKSQADDEALKREALAKAKQGVKRFKTEAKSTDATKFTTLDQFLPGAALKAGPGLPGNALAASKELLGRLPGNPKVEAAVGAGTTQAVQKMHADFVKGIGSMTALLEKPGNQIDMKYSNTQIFQGGDIRGGKLSKGAEETAYDSMNRVLERAKTMSRGGK